MLILFSMFLYDSDEGKVKYSPLSGWGSKVTILVGRHFQSGMLPFAFESSSIKSLLEHIFVRNRRPNKKCTFLAGLLCHPQKTFYDSGHTGGQKKLSQKMFFCMLILFSMILLDSDQGKVKYLPLYGRRSKVTISVGRHFQSQMLPFERASKKT